MSVDLEAGTMAARRVKKNEGLDDAELADLRRQLAEGKRPRVPLSGPQFPPGASGTISRIGDPETAGTDYITVRTKVNGVTDELAFAPAELSLRRRAGAARPAPASPLSAANHPATPRPAKNPVPPAASVGAAAPAPAKAAAASPARRRKVGAPPKVNVTLSSSGASWTVSATRGPKAVVRNVSVPPGVITALAKLLDQPALIEAVAEINETALAEAQDRAERLRAELAQLEAVLATHRAPR
jgi:hypothetical protein